jgi:hypothetical protein
MGHLRFPQLGAKFLGIHVKLNPGGRALLAVQGLDCLGQAFAQPVGVISPTRCRVACG